MKSGFIKNVCFLTVLVLCLSLSACSRPASEADIWSEALYTENTELGTGAKTVFVDVVALDKTVTFTVHSDQDTLGDALMEYGLIDGEQGAYGLYVKKVNGITADYDINQCYWGFNKGGESMMTGVDGAAFQDGEHYELVYTK